MDTNFSYLDINASFYLWRFVAQEVYLSNLKDEFFNVDILALSDPQEKYKLDYSINTYEFEKFKDKNVQTHLLLDYLKPFLDYELSCKISNSWKKIDTVGLGRIEEVLSQHPQFLVFTRQGNTKPDLLVFSTYRDTGFLIWDRTKNLFKNADGWIRVTKYDDLIRDKLFLDSFLKDGEFKTEFIQENLLNIVYAEQDWDPIHDSVNLLEVLNEERSKSDIVISTLNMSAFFKFETLNEKVLKDLDVNLSHFDYSIFSLSGDFAMLFQDCRFVIAAKKELIELLRNSYKEKSFPKSWIESEK